METFLLAALLLLGLQLVGITQAQSPLLDARCYLEGGGSAENFLVSEDITVGSVIGQLRINGDPRPDTGTISLSLRERDRDSPVQIEKGTKDLVLIAPLDKEGVRGPSSVYVNVVCDRKHSNDPSFIVPVNIRVTDVNDNAPQWVGNPYTISLSEVTVRGTRILQGARAVDLDQQGPFSTVEYQTLPGPYSDYVGFVSPLEGTLVLKKSLDYEVLKNFTVKLRAQDQGSPPKFTDTTLRVLVTDSDDQNPKFLFESYRGELPATATTGVIKVTPETIRAVDQDDGIQAAIQYTISASHESRFFSINPRTGEVDLITPLGQPELKHPITLVIKGTQVDNKDRYALATLIIATRETIQQMTYETKSRLSSNKSKLEFLMNRYEAKVREDTSVGSRILALPTNRPEKHVNYRILNDTQAEIFVIGQFGEVVLKKELDFEKAMRHAFDVEAMDGEDYAKTRVIIDVSDVNEWQPRFRQPYYRFTLPPVNEETAEMYNNTVNIPMAVGKIEAADGDINDKISFSLKGSHSTLFTVDTRGVLWLNGDLSNIKSSEINLLAMVQDSAQHTTTVPVTLVMDPNHPSLAQHSSLMSLFGVFSAILCIFLFIVILISIFVYKRNGKSKNRVHSNLQSLQSSASLVTHEKRLMNPTHISVADLALANPTNFMGSGSSLSAGASTILAASLEREAQQAHQRPTFRGRFYGAAQDDMEPDSINTTKELTIGNRLMNEQRSKKLSWGGNGNVADFGVNQQKIHEINDSGSIGGSTENNLIVYF